MKFFYLIILSIFLTSCDNVGDNLPTCPDGEKVTIGYRNGKPMKLCDQTYTFIHQDINYSCYLSDGKDSGTLGFVRSSTAKEVLKFSESQTVEYVRNLNYPNTNCNYGKLSPEYIQLGYTGKGDGSKLTHTKTLGF